MEASEFKRRFLSFHPKLYRLALRITGSREDAEDMVQDAYLKLWSRRDELEAVENPEAFCVTVLRNVCFNALRGRKTEMTGDGDDDNHKLVAAETDVGREVEARDAADVVMGLIRKLPDNQREVMLMRDVGDCPYDEIEAVTGLSSGNVRTLLSRARKKIKEQFFAIQNYELKQDR